MTTKALIAVLSFATLLGSAAAQNNQLGVCGTSKAREERTAEFIIESRSDSNSTFVAKRPCTNETVRIQRCAVIKVRDDKLQHWCRGTGKPTYYEEVDTVEYWGDPRSKDDH
jgi:hypothetical protein